MCIRDRPSQAWLSPVRSRRLDKEGCDVDKRITRQGGRRGRGAEGAISRSAGPPRPFQTCFE
eukprot:1643608-Alexandrium_andersonii.AAC.1